MLPNLLDLSLGELESLVVATTGNPKDKWRAADLFKSICLRGARHWDEITSLSSAVKHQLPSRIHFDLTHLAFSGPAKDPAGAVPSPAAPSSVMTMSSDGTIKWVLDLKPSASKPRASGAGTPPAGVEAVFIPEVSRGTACLSSQVGCSLSCKFCHTGTMPKSILRNLSSGEILLQLLTVKHHLKDFPTRGQDPRQLTNVVMMGMGEPLYNYKNVKKGSAFSSFSSFLSLILLA